MKKMMSALVAVSALAVAVPAVAQDYRGDGRGYERDRDYRGDRDGYDRYDRNDRYDYGSYSYDRNRGYGYETPIQRMSIRIEQGVRAGTINRREAANLRANLQDIRRLDRQYHRDGRMSQWERNDIERRIARLQDQLRRYRMIDGGYRR